MSRRRKYSDEQRLAAVKLVIENHMSCNQVAKNIGTSESVVRRRLKRINSWISANLLLILPMVILWTAKYMSAPVLFSFSMAILEVADIYIKCNLIYLSVFIYRKTKKSRLQKNNP